jgi:glycosyltransferase involved in cell wall biosynthesis
VVFHIHSGGFLDYYQSRGRAMRFFIREVLRGSDRVVVLTASWKKKIEELVGSGTRISVVGNPIDTSKYHPFPRDSRPNHQLHLLFLGALIKNKGVYDIVDCLARLKQQGFRVRVTLAGDRELDKVREHARHSGVEDLIDLPGWVDEATKLELLRNSELLLLPSYNEGLPLCVLEAMAVGLPVVCSNAGGLADLVSHAENGFIVAPGDVEKMAKYIATLAQDSSLREQMGLRNAKKIRDVYSVQAVAQQIGDLYRELTSEVRHSSTSAGGQLGSEVATTGMNSPHPSPLPTGEGESSAVAASVSPSPVAGTIQ